MSFRLVTSREAISKGPQKEPFEIYPMSGKDPSSRHTIVVDFWGIDRRHLLTRLWSLAPRGTPQCGGAAESRPSTSSKCSLIMSLQMSSLSDIYPGETRFRQCGSRYNKVCAVNLLGRSSLHCMAMSRRLPPASVRDTVSAVAEETGSGGCSDG